MNRRNRNEKQIMIDRWVHRFVGIIFTLFTTTGFCLNASEIENSDTVNDRTTLSDQAIPIAETTIGGDIPVTTRGISSKSIVYIKGSKTREGSLFGSAVALSGDSSTLAVGAESEGAVYVFTLINGQRTRQAYVKGADIKGYYGFGAAVALSRDGNTLAVGAPFEFSSATGIDGNPADRSAGLAGAVYVYTRSDGTWIQQAYVKASNTEAHDEFGLSVALSSDGGTLAVGATGEDSSATGINGSQTDNLADDAGAVYIFTRKGLTWTQQAYVKASNTGERDAFGEAVSLSDDGNTLAVGAIGEGAGENNQKSSDADGAVYIFMRRRDSWSEHAWLKIPNTYTDGMVGAAVALSGDGNTLAVGSPDRNLMEAQKDASRNAIAVHVLKRSGGTWSSPSFVKVAHTQAGDWFGGSLALSRDGNTLAVGALGEDSNATGIDGDPTNDSADGAGAAYVFVHHGGTWNQLAYIKASNTDAGDHFGKAVALSDDGKTLAVGAPREASSATGISGDPTDNSAPWAGAVYLYH